MNRIIKRVLVGRPVSSHEESAHRLTKKIALAVFSSDALSSSAYATDEILLALVVAGGAALHYSVPISITVAAVLAIVVISYRQTVQEYPSGGGAYIVAHENLGTFPGVIAASALLIDYVLTVSVSVAAGIAAVVAAFPSLNGHQLSYSLIIVLVVTVLNLRGLKESGTIFAIPTYGFLFSVGAMIIVGVVKVATGHFHPYPAPVIPQNTAFQAVTLYLILRAFASGCTAMTGVEAISNGVPAFRHPESKNASSTLLTLGLLLAFLFLGVTFLARTFHVNPFLIAPENGGKTVTAQIAAKAFGASSVMFYVVQSFTALILFIAANTSYADFPRLASILAKDRFLPRVLQNRGDKLAFSNGIVILAAAAALVLVKYRAEVNRIIPLYVIGVFTSFTLSQSGMVVHWFRKARAATMRAAAPPRAWKRSALVSGIGAVTTGIVGIVVSIAKFPLGAWQVIVLIPIVAYGLYRINKHYGHVSSELQMGTVHERIDSDQVVLLVSRFRGATKALAFSRALAPTKLHVVAFRATQARVTDLQNRWDTMGVRSNIDRVGPRLADLIRYINELNPTVASPVTVVLPDPQYKSVFQQVLNGRSLLRLKRAFLNQNGVVLISVPFRPDVEPEPKRLEAPHRLSMIVFVSSVNRASFRALEYARSLRPSDLKALTIQTDPGEAARLTEEWAKYKIDVPLEVVDSPYRSLIDPLRRQVRELHPNPEDAVGVVVPEFVVNHWWQAMLHNQTALMIKTALLFEPNVVVINVPYRIDDRRQIKKRNEKAAQVP
ncbi:MAG: APC family permease [Actinomycetota bacterium]|nr:APC family permease [Actinomycetota bacterium]